MAIEEIKLRKWGHSIGVVVPQRVVRQYKFRAGEKVEIIIRRKTNVLKKMFGSFKFKEPIEQIIKESDRLLYNER